MKHRGLRKILLMLFTMVFLFQIASMGTLAESSEAVSATGRYPFVLVHGVGGFGSIPFVPVDYFGGTAVRLRLELKNLGYEVYAPSTSSWDSAWDQACELYAALTGTTVDYGAAHSTKYHHKRYGKTFEKPLVEGWGQKDGKKSIKKVNLITHSFGGKTALILSNLLQHGDAAERAAGGDVSSLFTGGKGDWIFSITSFSAPFNGVSAAEIPALAFFFKLNEDSAMYECTIEGATAHNVGQTINKNTYYISYALDGTKESDNGKDRVSTSDMHFFFLRPLSDIIGIHNEKTVSGITIDDEWLPNDGLVNTISATHPFNEPSRNITDLSQIKRGAWNVMPTIRGDHPAPCGLIESKAFMRDLYIPLLGAIDALAQKD